MPTLNRLLPVAISAIVFLIPFSASAHEHRVFAIRDKTYSVTVGALNEPVSVDDKSGVEVIVQELIKQEPGADGDDGPSGTPVTGLEKTLSVEVTAGDQKKIFALEPEYGKPGSYQAVFYPTVQTTYSYQLMGYINNLPFGAIYTCVAGGGAAVADDMTVDQLSANVKQIMKGGSFGCPMAKADVQFPEKGATSYELASGIQNLQQAQSTAKTSGYIALVLAIVALCIALDARRKVGKHS